MENFTSVEHCFIEWLISSCNDDPVEDESVAIYENDGNTRGEIINQVSTQYVQSLLHSMKRNILGKIVSL